MAPGLQELRIDVRKPVNEPMILANGVYVACGNRPTGAALEAFNAMSGTLLNMTVPERVIPADQSTEGVLLGDFLDYGIGPVTAMPANSDHVNNCIAVNAVGVAKNGKHLEEQRGLYVHVNPAALVLRNEFRARYAQRINEMREGTHQFTRDIAFLGGALGVESPERARATAQRWLNLVEELTKLSESLDVEPTLMRPTLKGLDTSVCMDTQNRTTIVRPSADEGIDIPSEIFPQFILASQARKSIQKLLSSLQWQ